jgi:hydroxypyruvate reductase
MELERARADAKVIFDSVLRALDPAALVQKSLTLDGRVVHAGESQYEVPDDGRIVVLGVGKSGVGMARGVEAVFGDRLSEGLVVTKRGLGGEQHGLRHTLVREADHPVPDNSSSEAGEDLLRRAEALAENDLAIVVISGGGSALIEAPIDGISLDEFKTTTSLLLKAGADISTLNAVRRRLSRIKAGGLARAIAPAKVINLILSDVLGNPLNVIASGPTVEPDVNDRGSIDRLRSRDVWSALPGNVRQTLEKDAPDEPVTNVLASLVIGDSSTAMNAAAQAAGDNGYNPIVYGSTFHGEAREFARFWSTLAVSAVNFDSSIPPDACLIAAGEMTVTVRGDGIGGRNTEMAAAAAIEIDGIDGVAIASLATDGDDGVSEATGGVVVGDSASRVRDAGLDPAELLAENDTRAFLDASGGLIVTGQTGINVNDLYLALIP